MSDTPAALADSTDEEALALVMNVLQRIADTALEGFKGDTLDEATALSDINNFSRDTIDALAKRTMDSRTPPVRAALDKPSEAMVLAGGDVLLTACSSNSGQLNPWKPFDVAQVAIKVWTAMAALRSPTPFSGTAVTDEMVTAAMREFERMSSVLRYREKDKWHSCDIMGMRDALKAAFALLPPSVQGAER